MKRPVAPCCLHCERAAVYVCHWADKKGIGGIPEPCCRKHKIEDASKDKERSWLGFSRHDRIVLATVGDEVWTGMECAFVYLATP